MKKSLIILGAATLLTACSNTNPPTPPTPPVPEDGDYGELIIKDIPFLYYEMESVKLNIEFTKPKYAETITYDFKSSFIEIRNDTVYITKRGQSNIKVKAKTEHHSEEFYIYLTTNINMDRLTRAEQYLDELDANVTNNTTVFLGDSFFDKKHFWKNFESDVGGDAHSLGISSSTIEEWGLFFPLLFKKVKPKNLVFHLGTNDIWDLKESLDLSTAGVEFFFDYVHELCPNTNIILCSVENRTYKAGHTLDMADTIAYLKEYDAFVRNYCSSRPFMKYLDSLSHFVDENWNVKTNLLKDGCHPKDSEYKFYVEEAIKLGCDITYIGG